MPIHTPHRTRRWLAGCCVLLFLIAIPQANCIAAGTDFSFAGSDLNVDISTKWAGGRDGGYFPIRLRIRNTGPARELKIDFQSTGGYGPIPNVSRQVVIEQNQVLRTSLLIPQVSYGNSGRLRISEGGRVIKGMERSISLADVADTYDRGITLLIISDRVADADNFDKAAQMMASTVSSGGYYHGSNFYENVDPEGLPDSWVAYTGIDLIAITKSAFTKSVSDETRAALLQWVHSGGSLLIYSMEAPLQEDAEVNSLVGWDQRAMVGKEWDQAQTGGFQHLNLVDPSDGTTSGPEDLSEGEVWPVNSKSFALRNYGLGQICYFAGNPFPGTVSHWTWLLKHLGGNERLFWIHRHGFSARRGTPSFLKFLIPSVGRVPIVAFLILITLFTILIGPVNYAYCVRKKRLSLLLLTVPLLAFGSSLVLVTYSTIAHGFNVKSRERSVTWLDQKTGTSISVSRVAYYAGMAPSQGLSFEPTTAVYPIWASDPAVESARVNWSDRQLFPGGWLRSRTRTQFLTVSQREQRGRVVPKLTSAEQGKGSVANGLEWPIHLLVLKDENGKIWVGKKIAAGAEGQLVPAEDSVSTEIRNYLSPNVLELPDGVSEQDAYYVVSSSRRYYGYNQNLGDIYKESLQEELFTALNNSSGFRNVLKNNSYFAILDQSPDLDLGLDKTQSQLSVHLLMGFY
ncbi:MAG: hypothetical protein KDA78_09585 [Planctomycetaceae bacterium]|nr:hypothetical protein [Planctomycetaceae bacterium]